MSRFFLNVCQNRVLLLCMPSVAHVHVFVLLLVAVLVRVSSPGVCVRRRRHVRAPFLLFLVFAVVALLFFVVIPDHLQNRYESEIKQFLSQRPQNCNVSGTFTSLFSPSDFLSRSFSLSLLFLLFERSLFSRFWSSFLSRSLSRSLSFFLSFLCLK